VGALTLGIHALPGFCLALLLILAFSLAWPVLPSSGLASWDHAAFSGGARLADHLRHLALPLTALALPFTAWVARHQRASLLAVIHAPFLRTARALGLSGRRVLWAHALPAALPPILALAGTTLPALVGGAVVVETVFALPGMGRLLVQSVMDRDTPVVLACFLLYALLVVVGSTLADLGVAALDPRAREQLVRRG
jgi:peptide/nickel transport system permease protein